MQISDSEKVVMDVLWRNSPLTAKSIIDAIDPAYGWQDKTIKTLINRLLKKDAIKFAKQGREYLYSPILKEQDYIEAASSRFVDRVFNGKVSSLVAAFARQQKLSKADVDELKILIQGLEKGEK